MSVPESAALQSARAVVTVNAEVWANDLSQYCSQQVVTSVAYNSPASQQAWSSSGIGLPSSPATQLRQRVPWDLMGRQPAPST